MVVTTVAVTVTSSSPAASSSQPSHSQQGSSPRPAMRGSSKPQTAARDPCRAPSADHMHRLFVIICRLFVVIVGTHCMRIHPSLSSQRGASAEFLLRVEAPQQVGVGPPAPCAAAASLLVASTHSAGAVSEIGCPPPHGGGASGDGLGQAQAMLDGDELTPAARCGLARRRVRSNESGSRPQATSPDLHRCRHV